MRATAVALLAIVAAVVIVPAIAADETGLRVGTYDNRAIAIAYANSDLLPVAAKKAEQAAARAAGDTAKVRELEAWGERHQQELHLKGFCHAPVDDLLALVADGIPTVAANAGVDVIARACDFVGEGVEVVDVTMELVMLFNPRENAFVTIEEMKKVDAVPIVDICGGHD
jgi:hypothetical protein